MVAVARAHASLIAPRRLQQLCRHIGAQLPHGAKVLDIGCGDGQLTRMISESRPDLTMVGADVFVRPEISFPVRAFNGTELPFGDGEFDGAILVDVLHHAEFPARLLRDIRRVTREFLVIKDHLLEGPLAFTTLALMDFAGNPREGVAMRHDYWPHSKWSGVLRDEGWHVDAWKEDLGLYPWPISAVCGRRLHFVARLSKATASP